MTILLIVILVVKISFAVLLIVSVSILIALLIDEEDILKWLK